MLKERYQVTAQPVDGGDRITGTVRFEDGTAYVLTTEYSVLITPPDRPALECGVEDGGWQKNGYTAAEYGWNEALERYEDELPVWVEVIAASVEPVAVKWLNIRKHPFLRAVLGDCPNCNSILHKANSDTGERMYCYRCGQRVDWSNDNE